MHVYLVVQEREVFGQKGAASRIYPSGTVCDVAVYEVVPYARTAQNLNAIATGAIDVKVINAVKAACSSRIAELERCNGRPFATNIKKSIRGAVSYIEANADRPGAPLYGKVLKVRICYSIHREYDTSRSSIPTKDRGALDSTAKAGQTDRITTLYIDSA